MTREDELSIWLGAGILRAGGEDIQVLVLDSVRKWVASGATLDQALGAIMKVERQAGDFGAEIVGALALPILIEALKSFWTQYATELQKEFASEVVTFTVEKVKALFRAALHGKDKENTLQSMEATIREAAAKHGLDASGTERLVALVKDPKVADELDDTGCQMSQCLRELVLAVVDLAWALVRNCEAERLGGLAVATRPRRGRQGEGFERHRKDAAQSLVCQRTEAREQRFDQPNGLARSPLCMSAAGARARHSRGRPHCRFLSRQDHYPSGRFPARRRLRSLCPGVFTIFYAPHPGQSNHRDQKYAGRERMLRRPAT